MGKPDEIHKGWTMELFLIGLFVALFIGACCFAVNEGDND